MILNLFNLLKQYDNIIRKINKYNNFILSDTLIGQWMPYFIVSNVRATGLILRYYFCFYTVSTLLASAIDDIHCNTRGGIVFDKKFLVRLTRRQNHSIMSAIKPIPFPPSSCAVPTNDVPWRSSASTPSWACHTGWPSAWRDRQPTLSASTCALPWGRQPGWPCRRRWGWGYRTTRLRQRYVQIWT